LAELENSQQHHEHEGQNGGGFGNLSSASFGGEPSSTELQRMQHPMPPFLGFQKIP